MFRIDAAIEFDDDPFFKDDEIIAAAVVVPNTPDAEVVFGIMDGMSLSFQKRLL